MFGEKPKESSLDHSAAGIRSRVRSTGKRGAKSSTFSPAVTGPRRRPRRLPNRTQFEAEHRTPMAGLFLLDDGRTPRDPLLLGTDARDPSASPSPSPSASYGQSRLLEALVDELLRGRTSPPKGRPKDVGCSSTASGSGSSSPLELRKRKRDGEVEEVVQWARSVAACPWDPARVVRERQRQILTARRALFLKTEEIDLSEALPELLELPWAKRRSASLLSKERHKKQSMSAPTRRSERIAKKMTLMTARLLTERKHIGQGDQFQITVPEWTGPPSEKEVSDYKADSYASQFLGTPVCTAPVVITDTEEGMPAKGRPDLCSCPFPGSMACVRHHVSMARNQLRSELGPVFLSWGFDSMGEEVSNVLTPNEQMKFHALEQLNPCSESKTFWGVVSKHFRPKNRKDLLNYYFNVYLLRRVGNQTRSETTDIDSDEDIEVEDEEECQDDEEKLKPAEEPNCGLSRRSQKGKKNP